MMNIGTTGEFSDKKLFEWNLRFLKNFFPNSADLAQFNTEFFSLHDIANYDVAASIDHILAYTGQSKLSMIGHSAGGNEFYALLSEKPSYNDKIKVLINWGSSPVIKRFDCPLLAFVLSISRIVKV